MSNQTSSSIKTCPALRQSVLAHNPKSLIRRFPSSVFSLQDRAASSRPSLFSCFLYAGINMTRFTAPVTALIVEAHPRSRGGHLCMLDSRIYGCSMRSIIPCKEV